MIILLFLFTLAIALLAQWQVKRMYRRYSLVPATSGHTGTEVAQKILLGAGIRDVEIAEHDEMLGDHYKEAKGYKAYGDAVDMMKAAGKENIAKAYVEQQIWGTPDQMLRKFEERWNYFGPYGVLGCFRFAGTPMDVVERSMKLFSAEVLPVLRTWTAEAPPKQASAAA